MLVWGVLERRKERYLDYWFRGCLLCRDSWRRGWIFLSCLTFSRVDFSVEDQGNLDVVGGGKRAFYTVCKGPNLAQPYMNLLGLKNKVTTCGE